MPVQVIALDALPDSLQRAISSGTDRALCPRCKGGQNKEVSLSLQYRDGGVISLWCYRSTCGFKAITLDDPSATYTHRKLKEAKVYDQPTIPLQGDPLDRLISDYGLDEMWMRAHGWRLSEDGNWLVMPVRDPYGLDRGHITRTVYETPKRVYTYKATSLPFLDYWLPKTSAPVVVVEDTLSACRLSQLGYNSVALLGTGMSHEDAKEIRQVCVYYDTGPVILALDRDAFDKALKLKDRHCHVLPMQVRCLTEDIKNMEHDDDIKGLIDGRQVTSGGDTQRQESL